MNRREFVLSSCTAAVAGLTSQLSVFGNLLTPSAEGDILVVVFLRGGADALQFLAPVSDAHYIAARPTDLRIAEKGTQKGLELKNTLQNLDFQLHHKAGAFKELYDSKQLAMVHAVGLPNGTRSHFEAINLIERGLQNQVSGGNNVAGKSPEGWLSRLTSTLPTTASGISALAAGGGMPLSLMGSKTAISVKKTGDFQLYSDPRLPGLLKSLYANTDTNLSRCAQKTIETARYLLKTLPRKNGEILPYKPSKPYPTDDFSRNFSENLQTLAQLIKTDMGLRVATVDFGGWDTHENQTYFFPELVQALSNSVAAFYNDLSAFHPRLNVVVMSEFGRRLKANTSNGTDHGLGGLMFTLGGNVLGGKMYGTWQGLATDQLDNRVDLAATTDYRTVLAEICQKRFGVGNIGQVFPSFQLTKPLGLVK
jgi:uncharacterized protein (DUF1501 family)